jgi:DNA-binding transcriptional ArsR family regulator
VTRFPLTRPVVERIAERLHALGEPNRLAVLAALRGGERTVTELIDETGLGQANMSKHLRILFQHGFVARRKEGLNVYYGLMDSDVFRICDILCGRLQREARDWSAILGPQPAKPVSRGRATRSTAASSRRS